MRKTLELAWQRFNLNSSIVADGNGRFIATLFLFYDFASIRFAIRLVHGSIAGQKQRKQHGNSVSRCPLISNRPENKVRYVYPGHFSLLS